MVLARENREEVVVSAAEGQFLGVAVCGGQVDFGGGVGRDDDGPLDTLASMVPVALDGATDGAVGAVDAVESVGHRGAQFYRGVSGFERADACKVFVLPC